MQKQQSQVSPSTRHRFQQHDRISQLKQYLVFKDQYENLLCNDKIQYLKNVYPHGILGRNFESKVVVLDRIGTIKTNQLSKAIDDETLVGYIFQRLIYLSEHVLKERQQIIWIFDLQGKIMQLASKKMYNNIEKVIENAQKYFPGMLSKLYFINTPMLFDAIWSKINEKINTHTLQKVIMLNNDIDELLTEVDLTLLPKSVGGGRSGEVLSKAQSKQQLQKQRNQGSEEDEREVQIDINSLKMALSGLKLGINHHPSVANTPLNTEADEQSRN